MCSLHGEYWAAVARRADESPEFTGAGGRQSSRPDLPALPGTSAAVRRQELFLVSGKEARPTNLSGSLADGDNGNVIAVLTPPTWVSENSTRIPCRNAARATTFKPTRSSS